jgi:hypothetical protein
VRIDQVGDELPVASCQLPGKRNDPFLAEWHRRQRAFTVGVRQTIFELRTSDFELSPGNWQLATGN